MLSKHNRKKNPGSPGREKIYQAKPPKPPFS